MRRMNRKGSAVDLMVAKISVIIPALNEEKYIKNVIGGLKKQAFMDFETIVVDGGSSDRTVEIARLSGCKVVTERRKGIGRARNSGARAALGSIIFFTNADTRASPGLLRTYYGLFSDGKVVAATGPLVPLEKTTRFIRFGYRFASVFLAKLSFAMHKPAISGSNFAIRRSAFRACGGFDESLATYEDLDLAHRLGKRGKVVYVDDAVVATSSRRIVKWGVARYIIFNAANIARYNLFRKPAENYEPVR